MGRATLNGHEDIYRREERFDHQAEEVDFPNTDTYYTGTA